MPSVQPTIEVRVYSARSSVGKLRRVRAYPTSSPYFVITRRLGPRFFYESAFTITHVPTGRAIFPAESIHHGRLIAAIAAALPVNWATVTAENYPQAYAKVDKVWAAWARALQFPNTKKLPRTAAEKPRRSA